MRFWFASSVLFASSLLGCNFDTSGSSASGANSIGGSASTGEGDSENTTASPSTTGATGTTGSTGTSPPDTDGPPLTTSPTTGPDTTDSGDSSETGEPPPPRSCDAGGFCLPFAPVDWIGPVVIGRAPAGTDPLACPAGFTEQVRADQGLSADPAECACTCDGTVADCSVDYTYYDNGGCNMGSVPGTVGTTCETLSPPGAARVIVGAPVANGAACEPNESPPVVPPVGWAREVLLCAGAGADECSSEFGDGACYENGGAGFGGQFCIYRAGRHECPAGGLYTDRGLVFDNVDDTRGCGECTCGEPTVGGCSGSMVQFSDAGCSTMFNTPAAGDCEDTPAGATFSARYVGAAPTVSCEAPVVSSTGEAVGLDPTTICCSGETF